MRSKLATGKMVVQKDEHHAYGWSSIHVRASPKDVLIFVWDRTKRRASGDDDIENSVDERSNNHSQLV